MNVPDSSHDSTADLIAAPVELTSHDTYVRQVHSALSHLYDNVFLESHPLALALGPSAEHLSRAHRLRREILACIESLRPVRGGDAHADSARAYAIYSYRYVDGLAVDEICDRLALSRRQYYREHEKGMRAMASLLRDKLQPMQPPAGDNPNPPPAAARTAVPRRLTVETVETVEMVEAEVARLRQAQHPQYLHLRAVVDETMALLAPVLRQSDRMVHLAAGADPIVLADRVMLRQALLNVMSRVLPLADGALRVSVGEAGRVARLEIDGLPRLEPARLPGDHQDFEVARALIADQSGVLEFETVAGRQRICFAFPGVARPAMLVVDDNADLVALFQRYLGDYPVMVIGATSGEEALWLARDMAPRAITLDVMMPRQDGWDILQKLKAAPETRDIPVIVCSVLQAPQLAMSMGASGCITKPVSQAEFLDTVSQWLPAKDSTG